MTDTQTFIDYYEILGVDPACDARSLETAYHQKAKLHHPDHSTDADVAKFAEVIEAYKALKNPEDRAAYDAIYAEQTGYAFVGSESGTGSFGAALTDADAHARILHLLYKRRREAANDPGVGHYLIQESLGATDEVFEFHVWYLKEKGFVEVTERGTLAITIVGVDHVISTSQAARRERLLIGQSRDD